MRLVFRVIELSQSLGWINVCPLRSFLIALFDKVLIFKVYFLVFQGALPRFLCLCPLEQIAPFTSFAHPSSSDKSQHTGSKYHNSKSRSQFKKLWLFILLPWQTMLTAIMCRLLVLVIPFTARERIWQFLDFCTEPSTWKAITKQEPRTEVNF